MGKYIPYEYDSAPVSKRHRSTLVIINAKGQKVKNLENQAIIIKNPNYIAWKINLE